MQSRIPPSPRLFLISGLGGAGYVVYAVDPPAEIRVAQLVLKDWSSCCRVDGGSR